ncbi:MAG: MarR family winged helix-turn-helix transcriptional regulator [Brevibacterium sp.]|uniref:HTH marR-type domain-containing protein n=1 Tax=Brevibacterium aurantiacum TaxID=273384 RepID=A0A2A3ZHH9_BREAU|nr:MarR family transcriptional regulator [Brevibacterium aurantiacum]MDN5586668.1 MarR family transcriptional regulator [Brevibacterium sp.]PCC50911.1 hypothetical protein CIK62_04265 [Brevibacterium aurantiacum]PCC54955.1 hypothetical protein CIK59_03010 [Brevibacterium aurantiacum]
MKISEHGPVAVWRLMLETHADLLEAIEARFEAEHDLSANEFDVLINIPSTTTIRHRDLLESIVLSRSALSRLLRRLECRGLVEQHSDTGDRRGICVSLTDEGLKLRRGSSRTNTEVVRSAFTGLSTEDLVELHALVGKIRPRNATMREGLT